MIEDSYRGSQMIACAALFCSYSVGVNYTQASLNATKKFTASQNSPPILPPPAPSRPVCEVLFRLLLLGAMVCSGESSDRPAKAHIATSAIREQFSALYATNHNARF